MTSGGGSGPIPIVGPDAITPAWMTRALRAAGIDARVGAVAGRKIGTGQVGESVRFALTYDSAPADAPSTVVGKFPSPDPDSRAVGVNLGNYVREVRFYLDLAAGAGVTTPRCLFADVNPATSDFVLLMEDLAPAVPGDQLRGVSVAEAELVLEEAAKLHASHWGDRSLDRLPWVSDSAAAPKGVGGDTIRTLWDGFIDRYGDRVTPRCRAIGAAISEAYEVFKHGYDGPRCLVHGDFRPDNMMFGTARGGYPVAVVDWQSYGLGCCMADVSYFMAGALSSEERRGHEERLLRGYHASLMRLGVNDYAFERLRRDYARYSFALFNMAFIASMIVGRTRRGDDMFFTMLEGGADMVMDHGALDVLAAERAGR
jgi:hypothetical protein